ncbi:MAG: hypothetical protein FJ086_13740 [Deltaproteobacteria bacterium]|nr:hypothetical protein [Deltaproteobacteria bacterium]
MDVHLQTARKLTVSAVLPDKAIRGLVDAALDGTGRRGARPVLHGLGEDAFELVANPVKALVELGRAIRG